MEIPVQLKPALWGAVGGALALSIVGFTWGGWVTGGTAEMTAHSRAEAAVISALAPICVEQFRQSPNSTDMLQQLVDTNAWEQRSFVEDRGWATMPGSDKPMSGVASACANLLGKMNAG